MCSAREEEGREKKIRTRKYAKEMNNAEPQIDMGTRFKKTVNRGSVFAQASRRAGSVDEKKKKTGGL